MNSTSIIANIERILREGGTPQCSIWVERSNQKPFSATVHLHSKGQTTCNDCEQNDTILYNIGSLTKIFVAYALVILIERLANSDDPKNSRFRDLQQSWGKGIKKYLNIRLPGEPTIDNLLSHFKGLPTMNDFIFGPDGTVLMTMEEFPEIAAHIAWEYYESNERASMFRYGNGSYILAGILIETYSGVSLEAFLDDNIFGAYNMASTCVRLEVFEKLEPGTVALPHITSTDLFAQAIECPRYFGTLAFAAMGIYSCTKDLATFFRRLLDTLSSDVSTNQDVKIVKRFLHPCVKFTEVDHGFYSFCGHHTNLSTTQPGKGSLNRLVTMADSDASKYTLGVTADGKPLEAIHGSGIVTGYECCFYLMPKMDSFVIVLSNATGLVDTSDHIARFLLQDLFDLKYKLSKVKCLASGIKTSKAVDIDFVEKARLGAQERLRYINQNLLRGASRAIPLALPELTGHYTNEKYHQYVIVSCKADGAAQIQICGTAGRSRPFRVTLIDEWTLSLSQFPQEKTVFLSVDVFGDWKSLNLTIGRDRAGRVISLTRSREAFSVVYNRSS